MIQKPRGTMDILPKDVATWQFIESKARERGIPVIDAPKVEVPDFGKAANDPDDLPF